MDSAGISREQCLWNNSRNGTDLSQTGSCHGSWRLGMRVFVCINVQTQWMGFCMIYCDVLYGGAEQWLCLIFSSHSCRSGRCFYVSATFDINCFRGPFTGYFCEYSHFVSILLHSRAISMWNVRWFAWTGWPGLLHFIGFVKDIFGT